jgi:sucrose-6-phosphate hydrolase SacC (GH32 family)
MQMLFPQNPWRNAMTIPRELRVIETNNALLVASTPVKELARIKSTPFVIKNVSLSKKNDISKSIKNLSFPV